MTIDLSQFRNPVYHFRGPSTFSSPYKITDEALINYGVARELFGSTSITISPGYTFNVKDYQYVVGRDESGNMEVGMYFLPVSDNSFVPDYTGKPVAGSQVVDDYIRSKMGIDPGDEIYALISYMHPELSSGTIAELSQTEKNTLGFTHLGAYLGNGMTSNSPVAYHNHRFGCAKGGVVGANYGYPCNIHIVSLNGVDQKVFNRNCQLVDLIVGHGLQFPGDYQNSMFMPVYINAALMYYRDWLMQEDYLFNDPTWYFYCAANKLTILNIACNLPHNQNSFQEIFGQIEGCKLWNQFLIRYTNVTGYSFDYFPGLETDFIPLWKLEGLQSSDIIPFTIEQFKAYDRHRREGTTYNGPKPTLSPKAVICNAQSTADILHEFIQIYGDPYDAEPLSTIAVIWGFMQTVVQRLGISKRQYLEITLIVFQQLMYEDARVKAAANPTTDWMTNSWFWETYNVLITLFGGIGNASSSEQNINGILSIVQKEMDASEVAEIHTTQDITNHEMLAVFSLLKVISKWDIIMKDGTISKEDAYEEYIKSVEVVLETAEQFVVTNPLKIQYNVLPAVFHLISNALYNKNPLVSIQTICTAVDITEIQLKN